MPLRLRIWLTDINLGWHLDHVHALRLMARARTVFYARSGITRQLLRCRATIPVAKVEVQYLKPLLPGQLFEIHTRITDWDEKRFWVEQTFMHQGTLMVLARVQCVFSQAHGHVPPWMLLKHLGD